ncbi:MAG: protein kinase, partial [Candidatus Parabeggiatoa sp.]|nr:protein kinase [Candidatus Parabeggiatoa sp.]
QLVNVQLKQVLAALPKLQEQLGGIKSDTEEILAIVQQLMARADLSPQVKPRDELTQYNSANLELIGQARQLLKRIPPSEPQYSRAAIGLGSVVSSQGDLKQAEALFIKAYQQASNDKERALSAFNLFQVFTRQHVYDQALSSLQEAIKLNQQRYALHNVHTYTLQRILGAGGMGCVFLARHRLKKESVVIKCFWETLHGSADSLFKEAFLMSEIAGEYVPQPLDCGFVDLTRQERGYFISEYIEGAIDGETWLAKHGKLDVPTGISVGLQIAKGLQLAHDKGIFHLDLKPANILLQQQNEIVVKIIDFGLAKVAPSLGQEMATQRSRSGLSLLAQSAVFGTMDYAPPEQQGVTRYGEPSAKSDVYAFGKTLYRLLTGESPQTLHPRRLANAPELFELLCDCVEIDPGKRVDLACLIKGLMELLSPISQPQPPKQHRIVKIDKRRWWNQLDDNWQKVFKEAIRIKVEPTNSDLEKIVNLSELCIGIETSQLEKFKKLKICSNIKISDLQPLRALTNLQKLSYYGNQINDLEPLHTLRNLLYLNCGGNQISDSELDKFKKAVPNCKVIS